ncbi:hypothetical protein MMC29_005260 [Sticta canariensis]|nr:hypothetical protein [Sticta canariensis]
MCTSDIFLGLIAILFPPIAVWIKRGLCTVDSLINIGLCMLGYIPGLLHAWYIIAAYPEPDDDYEALPGDGGENTHVTYYYVSRRDLQQGGQGGGAGAGGQQRAYGTTEGMNAAAPPAQAGQQGQSSGEAGVPPSYDQAVRGDHKVQT